MSYNYYNQPPNRPYYSQPPQQPPPTSYAPGYGYTAVPPSGYYAPPGSIPPPMPVRPPPPPPTSRPPAAPAVAVPRLSFLDATKGQSYANAFLRMGPRNGRLTYDATRSLLMPYQVPTPTLDLIMRLASVVPAPGIGGYTLPECLLAMFLCDDFRRNGRVLSPLPDAWVREVQSAAGYVPPRPAAQAPPPPRPAPAPAPLTAPPRPATTSTTYRPPPRPAPPPATSSAPAPPSTAAPSTTGSASYRPPPPRQRSDPPTWAVPSSERSRHESIFRAFSKDGVLTGEQAKEVFGQFDVPVEKLADIWDLCNETNPGSLTEREFVAAMHLIDLYRRGYALPKGTSAPKELWDSIPTVASVAPQASRPAPVLPPAARPPTQTTAPPPRPPQPQPSPDVTADMLDESGDPMTAEERRQRQKDEAIKGSDRMAIFKEQRRKARIAAGLPPEEEETPPPIPSLPSTSVVAQPPAPVPPPPVTSTGPPKPPPKPASVSSSPTQDPRAAREQQEREERERAAREEAERQARLDAEEKARDEAFRARMEAEQKTKREEEAKRAAQEAEAKRKADEEARQKRQEEAERRAKEEEEIRKKEEEDKKKWEEEEKKRMEERKAREEAARKEREEREKAEDEARKRAFEENKKKLAAGLATTGMGGGATSAGSAATTVAAPTSSGPGELTDDEAERKRRLEENRKKLEASLFGGGAHAAGPASDTASIAPSTTSDTTAVAQPAAGGPELYPARAIFAYEASDADGLNLEEGDEISVEQENDEWLYGAAKKSGKRGWFPKSYVEKVESGAAAAAVGQTMPAPPTVTIGDAGAAVSAPSASAATTSPATTAAAQPAKVELYRAKALYDYDGTAAGPDNLTLTEDAVLSVTQEDGDWLFGKDVATGKEGWFPTTYVEKMDARPSSPIPPGAGAPPVEGTAYLCKATVLADFTPATDEELSVKTDEVVGIVEKLEDGWWMAEKLTADRKRGLVPETYVEEIPDTGAQGVAGRGEGNASAAIALATSAAAGRVVDPAKAAELEKLNTELQKELRAKQGLEKMLQQPSIPKDAVQVQLSQSAAKIDQIQKQIAQLMG